MAVPNGDYQAAELLDAIKNHQLVLYYQPQFSLSTSAFEGIEALIRWQHPQKGLLMPYDFIPPLEDAPVMSLVGDWVVETACRQNKAWQDKGLTPVPVAVNVCERQLRHPQFVAFITATLEKTGLAPCHLELELNEKIIIHDTDEEVIQSLHRLSQLGVQIALDDFGTGFTSLHSLKKLPIHKIKIDKTYIDNINNDTTDAAIVRAIITLANSLNLQIVVEGVESLKQLKMLLSNELVQIQGFYFSEPLPADEVEQLLFLHQDK
ncbi:MAG TPA: EAL domain-containing protein [Gammaproteobacteria bacterium]|jgi:EAL domain-containing protein (putative c-di-GMP-specific phosphodiesterase class I)|nr:EAL domain-containing protein [Gammaproteobacteria bacterium]